MVRDYVNDGKNAGLGSGVRKIGNSAFQLVRRRKHLWQIIPRRQKDVCNLKSDFVSHANLMTSR